MAVKDKDIDKQEVDAGTMEFEIAGDHDPESALAITNRERLERSIANQQNIWGYGSLGLEAKKAAMTMLSTKCGLYSRIPLVCKAEKCPYSETCGLLSYDLAPIGEYCPLETSQIELSFSKYMKEFGIQEDEFTDQNILREIINLEVMSERCKSLMAKEQTPIIDVISGVTEDGEAYTHPEVSKAYEMYERCQKQHTNLLSLMNATRKDKKGLNINTVNPMAEIMNKLKDIENNGGFVEPSRPIVLDNDEFEEKS